MSLATAETEDQASEIRLLTGTELDEVNRGLVLYLAFGYAICRFV